MPDETATTEAEPQSIQEMMRIMDVATALRKERETVQLELNRDQTRQSLRERLMAAAAVAGEKITPAEIDTAIEHYYDSLHSFREPARSFRVMLAHLYVRRRAISRIGAVAAALVLAVWFLFWSTWAPLSPTAHKNRQLNAVAASVDKNRAAIEAVVKDEEARSELTDLAREAKAYQANGDLANLRTIQKRLDELEASLQSEYTIRVLADPKEQSAVDRFIEEGPVSGYYLIVEARDKEGRIVAQTIRNQETARDETVKQWGERVPAAVYERLKSDKQQDGILNETLFAVKRKGYRTVEVKMLDENGQPITRDGQITSW